MRFRQDIVEKLFELYKHKGRYGEFTFRYAIDEIGFTKSDFSKCQSDRAFTPKTPHKQRVVKGKIVYIPQTYVLRGTTIAYLESKMNGKK